MSQKSLEENWTFNTFSELISHPFPFFYESNRSSLTPKEKTMFLDILKKEL
jgi:hypothetical protein